MNNFQSLVYSTSVDCFCVTESWLSANINSGEVLPSNYAIYRHDRGARGGGVLLAVSNTIPSRQLSLTSQLDVILVQLEVVPPTLVCCVYFPPGSSDSDFHQLLDILRSLPNQ